MAKSTERAIILFKTHKDIPKGSQLVFRDGTLWVWREGPEKARKKKVSKPKSLWNRVLRRTSGWCP